MVGNQESMHCHLPQHQNEAPFEGTNVSTPSSDSEIISSCIWIFQMNK